MKGSDLLIVPRYAIAQSGVTDKLENRTIVLEVLLKTNLCGPILMIQEQLRRTYHWECPIRKFGPALLATVVPGD
jgi:hypothetical protein